MFGQIELIDQILCVQETSVEQFSSSISALIFIGWFQFQLVWIRLGANEKNICSYELIYVFFFSTSYFDFSLSKASSLMG